MLTLTRSELQQIAQTRLEEAKVLLAAGFYDGAYYLAGYALETALKAYICKLLDEDFPPGSGEVAKVYRTHRFEELILLAGLRKRLLSQIAADVNFQTNWSLVKDWSEAKRYDVIGSSDQAKAQEFLTALDDATCGILTWIKTIW
jgi:HEPN domain-containing protein